MLPYAKTFEQERRDGASIGIPPTSKYSISDEPAFIPSPKKMHDSVHCVNPSNCLDKSTPKFGGQEGEAFNPTSKYSIYDEPAFVPKPDSALGPDVVTTLEHGPGIANQPKGVPLRFINGKWVEDFVWTEDLPYD